MYGFGKTPHPDHPLTIEDYANGVLKRISDLNIEAPILVGHSFGGRIAMRIATISSDIKGLILLDSAGILPRRGVRYYLNVARYKIAKCLHFKKLPQGSADYRALSGVMKKTFVNVVNESSEADARRIRIPTLLIWGSEDRDTPLYMCRKLHRLIKWSELLVVRGAGHFAYLEYSDYHYRVIRSFRESL